MKRRAGITGFVAATTVAAGLAFCEPPSPAGALTGMWQLNKHLSEAPKKPEGAGGAHFSGPFGGGMGGRHGGSGRYGGRQTDDQGGAEGQGPSSAGGGDGLFAPPTPIKIDLAGSDLRIISSDGHVRLITPDGKAVERERDFVTVTETAQWQDNKLVVTSSTPKGRTITETFSLADDGSGKLVHTVATAQAQSKESRSARWVYDPSPEATTAAPDQH